MRLDRVAIASLSVTLANGTSIAPGHTSALIVSVTQPNGEVLQTEGVGKGKVRWSDLSITSNIVKINKDGIVSLIGDPRPSEGKVGHVLVTVPSHPDVQAELDIPITYNAEFTANFSGARGRNGTDGTNGTDGSMGGMGSIDPKSPSPGSNGANGTDGSNGEDGQPGENALPVQVRITLRRNSAQPLLQVLVANSVQQELFLVDPNGGSITILADGGQGGFGGRGGRGGQGGPGGAGTPPGARGIDGMNGRDGFAAAQGKGALITVHYDPQILPYLDAIHLYSHNGPPPIFVQQRIGPLW